MELNVDDQGGGIPAIRSVRNRRADGADSRTEVGLAGPECGMMG